MSTIEKARRSGPIPNAVLADSPESKPSLDFSQALVSSVFGRGYIVERRPSRKRTSKFLEVEVRRTAHLPARSRIRSWRAA
jgi:hypothetical protein